MIFAKAMIIVCYLSWCKLENGDITLPKLVFLKKKKILKEIMQIYFLQGNVVNPTIHISIKDRPFTTGNLN